MIELQIQRITVYGIECAEDVRNLDLGGIPRDVNVEATGARNGLRYCN
jgi:hypothetical protein